MDKSIVLTIVTSSGVIGTFFAFVLAKLKKASDDSKALRYGVQALLRHNLYDLYHKYVQKQGYAPVWVKEDFENMYAQYHSLGANGVMDGIHEEFKKLPTVAPQESDSHEAN